MPNEIVVSFTQLRNAELPSEVRLAGRVIEVNPRHSLNAELPTAVTVAEKARPAGMKAVPVAEAAAGLMPGLALAAVAHALGL